MLGWPRDNFLLWFSTLGTLRWYFLSYVVQQMFDAFAASRRRSLDPSRARDEDVWLAPPRTPSLHARRIFVRRLRLIGVNHTILIRVESAMFRVQLLGSHRQLVTIFAGMETHGVIPPVCLGHAFGEGAGMNQVCQTGRVLVTLFVVLLLRPDDGTHVTQRIGFGFRPGRIPFKFWLICGLCR